MCFPKEPLAQICYEDAPAIHHESEIDAGGNLPEHIAKRRRQEDLPDLILNWSDDFLTKAAVVFREFILPERPDHRILNLLHYPGSIFRIVQHARDPEQASIVTLEQCCER